MTALQICTQCEQTCSPASGWCAPKLHSHAGRGLSAEQTFPKCAKLPVVFLEGVGFGGPPLKTLFFQGPCRFWSRAHQQACEHTLLLCFLVPGPSCCFCIFDFFCAQASCWKVGPKPLLNFLLSSGADKLCCP